MEQKTNYLKYLSPLFGILFCPVTIILLWSFWSDPAVEYETDFIEEVEL